MAGYRKEDTKWIILAIAFGISMVGFEKCDGPSQKMHYTMPLLPTEEVIGGYWQYDYQNRIWVKKYFEPDRTMGTNNRQGYDNSSRGLTEDELEDYLEDHVEGYKEDNYWGDEQY